MTEMRNSKGCQHTEFLSQEKTCIKLYGTGLSVIMMHSENMQYVVFQPGTRKTQSYKWQEEERVYSRTQGYYFKTNVYMWERE